VGDKLYGPDPELFARGADQTLTEDDHARLELPRHALHAQRLALDHPMTGVRLCIEAPVPDDFTSFWARVCGSDESGAANEGPRRRTAANGG
jgi:23S rRNA pseudouridine1911/1915/1917 synthase